MDFIRQNEMHLRVDPGAVEPGTVCPNPASWHRVDECLKHMNMEPSKNAGRSTPDGMYAVCLGMLGLEASIAFTQFVREYDRQISAEDVLNGDVKSSDCKDLPQSTLAAVVEKIGAHSKSNDWTLAQCKNVEGFAKALPGELMIQVWNVITSAQNIKNIQHMHKLMGQEVVRAVQASRNLK